MNSLYLDDRFDDEFWVDDREICPYCGERMELEDDGYCYFCSTGISMLAPIELKGGDYKMANEPVFKNKIGAFEAAVFMNDVNGKSLPSIVVEKSFTKDGGSWSHQKLSLLNTTEIDKLICVLQETKKAIYLKEFQ